MRRLVLSTFITLGLTCSVAHAQATINGHPADFDQYPSFLQTSIHLPNNVEAVLRCGYTLNGASIAADPGYMETSVLDPAANAYARYQRIDNKIIITTAAPGEAGRFLLQVIEPNGLVSAKICQMDLNSDTIQNCMTRQPFMPANQASQQDQTAAQQCGSLFAKALPQMNVGDYSAAKTDQFKNSLRQKVAILEAP